MEMTPPPASPSAPLNAFQRRYFAWAEPHYARMAPSLRHEVECLDRWLYSRAGLRFWGSLAVATVAMAVALAASGAQWTLAIPAAVSTAVVLVVVLLGAWLQPDRYTGPGLLKRIVIGLLLGFSGAAVSFVVIHLIEGGAFDAASLARLRDLFVRRAAPAMVLVLLGINLLMWSVATIRRFQTNRVLAAMQVAQERDAVARQLAEARLKLLQGQIQPHFIFNTLAAVQHWVDSADPRAGPLLRALTSFLRGSTELLAQDSTTFAVEIGIVRHYLAIMEARLGDRLRDTIAVAHEAASQSLPPGVLLTLVENAIEHGISPALHGGAVDISADDDGAAWTLRVRDDGVGPSDGWREGIGLRNCRERLQHLFGANASLTMERIDGTTVATVRIARGVS